MSKVAKSAVGLMIVTMISKVLGFGRELVLGSVYGASIYSDIYITTMNIPTVIFALIGSALATTFIPLYYENYNSGGEKKSLKFTNNILNIILIIGIILSIIGFIFAEQVVKIFAIGFEGEVLEIAIKFTRIMIFGGIFINLSNLMISFLQIKDNFIIPGLIGIPTNILIVTSILISAKSNIYILAIGTLIAISSQFFFQLPFAYKYGYRYVLNIDINDEYMKKMIWLVTPVFIGVGVNQINTIVDRTLASTLVEGSISALNYANKLNLFALGLFISTIASVIYPMLSKLTAEDNKEKFSDTVSKSVNTVILLIIPISIGAIVLARPVVQLLFQRGAFDIRATNMTATALVFYSIGMIGFGIRDVISKVFYSLQDTKTPMINGAIAMVLNIILNIILVKFMGHGGLAFATSISAIICIFLLLNSLKKKIGYFGQDKIINTMIKSLIAAVGMGVITNIAYKLLDNVLGVGFIQDAVALFASISIGAIVYAVLVVLLKVEEVNILVNMAKSKLNR